MRGGDCQKSARFCERNGGNGSDVGRPCGNDQRSIAGGRIGDETSAVSLRSGNGNERHTGRNPPAIGGQSGHVEIPKPPGNLFAKFRKRISGKVHQFHRCTSVSKRSPLANRLTYSFTLNKTPARPSHPVQISFLRRATAPPWR